MKKNLLLLMALCFCAFTNKANGQTWDIGNPNAADVTATFDNGTLTITGKGAMQDWNMMETPWYNLKDEITNVIVNEGVTTIGNMAFSDCGNLTSITISKSVTNIGDYALQITGLTEIHIENPTPPTVGWACFWAVDVAQCKLYVPSGTESLYAATLDWCLFDIVGCDDVCKNLFVQESKHIRLEILRPYLSISPDQVTVWLSCLDRMYEQYVDLMSGLTPYEGNKEKIRSEITGGWATTGGDYIRWTPCYIPETLNAFVNNGDWSFGILHEMAHSFGGQIGGFGTGNVSYNWNEELFANFRMYLALTKLPDAMVDMGGAFRYGASIADYYQEDYDLKMAGERDLDEGIAMWGLIRLGNYYQQNNDHGFWLYKQAFEIINTLPSSEEKTRCWTKWQKFNSFLDILSECAGMDVRETFPTGELSLIESLMKEVIPYSCEVCKAPPEDFNETLPDPTTSWQTRSGSIQSGWCYVYQVSVKSGQKYTFKTGCGDGATSDFACELFIYDNTGSSLAWMPSGLCESNGTTIEDYQFDYDGYAYVRVKGYGAIGDFTTYGNYTLAYRQTPNPDTSSNDQCTNAVSLSCGTSVQGTLAGATPTTSVIYDDGADRGDVFYKFTADIAGDYSVTLTKHNIDDDINLYVYSDCDAATPFVKLIDAEDGLIETKTLENCTAGTTYFLRAIDWSYSGGSFDIMLGCPKSSDATLSSLTVSKGTLTPAFDPNTLNYTVNVTNDVSSITIDATANYSAAKVSGTGTYSLNVGNTIYPIKVTAEDGVTTETYNVTVICPPGVSDQTWDISDRTGYGNNVIANLTNNTLTISGTGNMADFYDTQGHTMFGWDLDYRSPWWNLRSSINTVIIGDGVTNIGDGAFEDCSNLTSVTIPSSLNIIGITSFMNCSSLNNITLPTCINEIQGGAFYGCRNLTIDCRMESYRTITLNSSYEYGNEYPFNGIYKLRVMPWLFSTYPSNGYIKEVLYDDPSLIPKYEEQSISGTLIINSKSYAYCLNYKVYKVSVTEGVIYTFDFSGDGQYAGIYDSSGALLPINNFIAGVISCQSTFTGDAYVSEGGGFYSTSTLTYRCYLSAPTGVTAKQNSDSVAISWDSVSAATSYTLYRSSDGPTYSVIKTGISGTNTTDLPPSTGYYYYKIEADNSFTKSDLSSYYDAYVYYVATGINEIKNTTFSIYPNPVKSELFIKSDLQIKKVEICDISGRVVETWHAASLQNGLQKLSVSALSQGIYIVKIYTENGLVIRKVMKE